MIKDEKIRVKFAKDELLSYMKKNKDIITSNLTKHPNSNEWLDDLYTGVKYIEKNYWIDDFELNNKENPDSKIRIENAIILYESFKDLPRYLLTDERFWVWVYFEKAYETTLQAMPISSGKNVFSDHWLFNHGNRRSIFFGVLSRDFFVTQLTVDETLEDPYEYTRYALEKFERVRNLVWRLYSSQEHVIRGILKAHKAINEKYGAEYNVDTAKVHTEMAKIISKLGGISLLDIMDEVRIKDYAYKMYQNLILKENERNLLEPKSKTAKKFKLFSRKK